MLDTIFDNVLFNTLSSLSTLFIIFDVTIHFGLKTNEFNYGSTSCFIFKLTNDLLISLIIIWGVFRIIAIVEFVFVTPKVLVNVLSIYFVC